MRELMDSVGLPELVDAHLSDPRDPDRLTHPFLESVFELNGSPAFLREPEAAPHHWHLRF